MEGFYMVTGFNGDIVFAVSGDGFEGFAGGEQVDFLLGLLYKLFIPLLYKCIEC